MSARDRAMGMGGKTRDRSPRDQRGGGQDMGGVPDSSGNVNKQLAAEAKEARRKSEMDNLIRRLISDKREEDVEVFRSRQLNLPIRVIPTPVGLGIAALSPFLQSQNTQARNKFLSGVDASFYNLDTMAQEQQYKDYLESLRPTFTPNDGGGIVPLIQPPVIPIQQQPMMIPPAVGIQSVNPFVQNGVFNYGVPMV